MLSKLEENHYRNEIKGYSQSQLKRLLDVSPQQWIYEQQYPPEPTAAMVNGTLAHEIALEGLLKFLENHVISKVDFDFNLLQI